jgi:hypothetical protein
VARGGIKKAEVASRIMEVARGGIKRVEVASRIR